MDEIWKLIDGFDQYEISSFGRVRRIDGFVSGRYGLRKWKGRVLKHSHNPNGYPTICLGGSALSTKTIHRLVAMAFIPNPENKPCVNHINGVPKDNRIENLGMLNLNSLR